MIMELTLAPAESLVMQCLWESGADLTVYEITERIRRSGSIFAFVRSLIIVAFHPEQDLMSAFMGKGKSALPAQSMNLSRLNKAQIQKNLICFQRDCPLNALFLYGVLCIGISG